MDSSVMRIGFLVVSTLRAALFSLGASVLVGTLLIAQSGVNSSGDVVPFLFWTVFYTFGIAFLALAVTVLFFPLPRLLSYGLAIALGILISFLYAWFVALVLFFSTFSFPVGFAWLAGGISGLVAVAGVGSRAHKGNLLLELTIAALVSLGFGLGANALVTTVFQEREVDIVWLKWTPGPEPLTFGRLVDRFVTKQERDRLRGMSLGGHIEFVATGGAGRGPQSRMVIVMQQQVEKPIDLPIPLESTIYVQEKEGWRQDPVDVSTTRRSVHLKVSAGNPLLTEGWMEIPGENTTVGGVYWGDTPP